MKHNCKTLYEKLVLEHPEYADKGLEVYCILSEKPEQLDGINFHYGVNSLIWFINKLSDKLSDEDLESIFNSVIRDFKELNKPLKDLERNIRSFPSTRRYWQLLDN